MDAKLSNGENDWPWPKIHGNCHERYGNAQDKHSMWVHRDLLGPGNRQETQLHPLLSACSDTSMLLRCGCSQAKDLLEWVVGFLLWSLLRTAKSLASRSKNPLRPSKKKRFIPIPLLLVTDLLAFTENGCPLMWLCTISTNLASLKAKGKEPQIQSGLWKCATLKKQSPNPKNRSWFICTMVASAVLFMRSCLSCMPTPNCPHFRTAARPRLGQVCCKYWQHFLDLCPQLSGHLDVHLGEAKPSVSLQNVDELFGAPWRLTQAQLPPCRMASHPTLYLGTAHWCHSQELFDTSLCLRICANAFSLCPLDPLTTAPFSIL